MASPQDFYSKFLPYAKSVADRTGLDPRLVLAQAALETGYGRSAPNNNFFGIKSHGKGGGQSLMTKEFEGGQMVSKPQSFRGYSDPSQSFEDYASFILENPRYRPVLEARSLEDQIAAMAASGYATDPQYGAKLTNIASKFAPSEPEIIAADALGVLGLSPKPEARQQEPQMAGLLGNISTPPFVSTQGQAQERLPFRERLKAAAQSGELWDNAAMAFNSLRMRPDPAISQMAMKKEEARQNEKRANRTAAALERMGRPDLARMVGEGVLDGKSALGIAMQPAKDDRTALIKNYEFARENGFQGSFQDFLANGGGGGVVVNTGQNGEQLPDAPKDMIWARNSDGSVVMEEYDIGNGQKAMRPVSIPISGTKAEETARTLEGQQVNAVNQADQMLQTIDSTLNDPALGYATGANSVFGYIPGTGARRAKSKIDQLKGQTFLQAYERLKGGGVITEIEGQKAEQAIARLDAGMKDEDFVQALNELRQVVMTAKKRAEMLAGKRASDLTDQELLDLYGG